LTFEDIKVKYYLDPVSNDKCNDNSLVWKTGKGKCLGKSVVGYILKNINPQFHRQCLSLVSD